MKTNALIIYIGILLLVLSACMTEETPTTQVTVSPVSPTFTVTTTVPIFPSVTPTLAPSPTLIPAQTVTVAIPTVTNTPTQDLRAAWVHDNSISTPAKIDEMIRRAELGHINMIVANAYYQGMALYDSQYVPKHPEVASDFNPLAYLVDHAHQHGIQVNVWFINGPVDYKGTSKIMEQHPDWAIVGPDGEKMDWMNFQRPDVRQFVSDMIWEVVNRYGVDGVFFDFTRYPGPEWGFDPYSITTFDNSHNFKLEDLRYTDLPAYGYFDGNPIPQVMTAHVLATFGNGTPAMTINTYGKGHVIVLNWRASERTIGADSEIMRRSIQQLSKGSGQVFTYRPDGTLDDNAKGALDEMATWLKDLNVFDKQVGPQEIKNLPTNSVLIVTYGLDIPATDANIIQTFVSQGGGLIFNDGPTRSIAIEAIRTLTGLQGRGKYMEDWTTLTAAEGNALLPTSNRTLDQATAQMRDTQWKDFRKQGINALVQGVYQRIKAQYPRVDLSVTVSSNMVGSSTLTMVDWKAWLDGHYVDYIVPRGYVEKVDELDSILADWGPVMQKYKNVTLGVSTFYGKHNQRQFKSASDVLAEINRAYQAGSYGIMLWNLDYSNDDQLKALAAGPFR